MCITKFITLTTNRGTVCDLLCVGLPARRNRPYHSGPHGKMMHHPCTPRGKDSRSVEHMGAPSLNGVSIKSLQYHTSCGKVKRIGKILACGTFCWNTTTRATVVSMSNVSAPALWYLGDGLCVKNTYVS